MSVVKVKLRYPNIQRRDFGKPGGDNRLPMPIDHVTSYLYQLVDDLNVALTDIEDKAEKAATAAESASTIDPNDEQKAQATFNSIKALIIKSADIVNAYYEEIHTRLSGEYVAQSDFGTFVEATEQALEATSTKLEQMFTHLQEIITDIENVEHTLIEVNAHIKSGLLYYDEQGAPVYGLEIGQRTEIEGEEVFNQFARFTADKLSFFDSNGVEAAYISDKKLYIRHVEIIGTFTIGGFVSEVRPDGSVVRRWVERSGG